MARLDTWYHVAGSILPSCPYEEPRAVPAVLTGADLHTWRTGQGLNRWRWLARLGVTQGAVSKAEGAPRNPLGPALQQALQQVLG